jgi:hypothetical protein
VNATRHRVSMALSCIRQLRNICWLNRNAETTIRTRHTIRLFTNQMSHHTIAPTVLDPTFNDGSSWFSKPGR